MLVRRGVIDRIYGKSAEDRLQTLLVPNAAKERHNRESQTLTLTQTFDLPVHVVKRKLRDVQKDQLFGRGCQNLPAELCANTAACARHHHHFVGDASVHQFGMGGHRFSTQKIIEVHVLNLINDRATGYQLTDFRDSANSDRKTLEGIDDCASSLLRRGWNR